jgi:hypothetical protein
VKKPEWSGSSITVSFLATTACFRVMGTAYRVGLSFPAPISFAFQDLFDDCDSSVVSVIGDMSFSELAAPGTVTRARP